MLNDKQHLILFKLAEKKEDQQDFLIVALADQLRFPEDRLRIELNTLESRGLIELILGTTGEKPRRVKITEKGRQAINL